MENHGVLRDKLDIKLLLLFILRRLPGECRGETLSELVLDNGGVGYFEYAECLGELIDTENVKHTPKGYAITEKGDRNCEIVESSLPYTIRARLAAQIAPMAERMRRDAMITAAHSEEENGCRVELGLSDGLGSILEMRLLCGSGEQAEKIEEHFRANAEDYYNRIMELLLE